MTSLPCRSAGRFLLAAVAVATACRTTPAAATRTAPAATAPAVAAPPAIPAPDAAAIARARADSVRYPYTAADVHFMSAMIGHHSQAILMAGWAPTHGASQSVQTLAERIINAQQDEITSMQRWLSDRQQPVPDAHAGPMKMMMGGVEHEMLMPGMLTDAQLAQLDAARGPQFDRLFLTFMIQHHRGAVSMVKELLDTYGAAQNETVFKFANDVSVDQSTEIARMERMLAALPPG
jgi:uncharacterized protein (DUF305 family)